MYIFVAILHLFAFWRLFNYRIKAPSFMYMSQMQILPNGTNYLRPIWLLIQATDEWADENSVAVMVIESTRHRLKQMLSVQPALIKA